MTMSVASGGSSFVQLLLVEHAALAVERDDLALEAVRFDLRLEVVDDVSQILRMRSGVLTSTAILAAVLARLSRSRSVRPPVSSLVGCVDRGLVDVQLDQPGASKCSCSVAPSRIDSSKP